MRYILPLLFLPAIIFGFIIEIPANTIDYAIVPEQGYDRLVLDQTSSMPHAPGCPEIPVIVFTYLIPRDQIARDIVVIAEEWDEIPGSILLFPTQSATSIETSAIFVDPDPRVYQSMQAFPSNPIHAYSCGTIRGCRVLQIAVAAFRYIPAEQRLYRVKRLALDIICEYARPSSLLPFRTSRYGSKSYEYFLSKTVLNKEAIYDKRFMPQVPVLDDRSDPLSAEPTDLPSLLGPPVDMVIITTTPQSDAYQRYADLKKLCGLNTVVKTLSWIRQHYSGVDDADRIRNFIREAMQYWGVMFVLLGGDPPVMPTRYVWVDRSLIYPSLWLPIASDLYFSDLDGNWNYDGDEKFGELCDSLDLYPDVFIGRIPSAAALDVEEYMEKIRSYTFPEHLSHQTKALFFSSYLAVNWPGLPYAVELAARLPDYFQKSFISEYNGTLTIEALHDSIHAGFGIVTGIGHGDVNTMCFHYNPPRMNFNNFFYDSLANSDLYSIMVVVTCYTNPFQADCLGEHWLMNPAGGGIAYIGPTSSSEGSIHKEYMKLVFDSLFTLPLAQTLALAKVFFIPNAQYSNWHRVHQFSLSLLGDPTLRAWDRSPKEFSNVVVEPETLAVGLDELKFTVNPAVSPRAIEMLIHKENEVYLQDTFTTLEWTYELETESAGHLKYVLNAQGFVPWIDSVPVVPVAPCLAYHHHNVLDSTGNANGVINPGENVALIVALSNNGGMIATNIHVQLACADTLLSMAVDTSAYPDIPPGEVVENNVPFTFDVSSNMPDEHSFEFELQLICDGDVSCDSFQAVGQASDLDYFRQTYRESGDTLYLLPYVMNTGHEAADSLIGYIQRVTDSIVVLDSVVIFPVINAGEIKSSEPDSFALLRLNPGGEIRLRFSLYRQSDELWQRIIEQRDVPAVTGLRARPCRQSLELDWAAIPAVTGYRVYRSLSPDDLYEFCMNHLEPVCHFEDFQVEPGVDYYYYVEAVDSFMNQGAALDTICSQTNPRYAAGWPQDAFGYLYGGPNFGDIDPFYPGLEIVATGQDAGIYMWHSDGTPITGANGRVLDLGESKIWSSPAVGDVNGDGRVEVVFGLPRGSDNLYVVGYDNLSDSVVILPGWPVDLESGGLVSSPVLADIDEDGDLEIFAMAAGPARLYVFHHDGVGVFDSTGILKCFNGVSFGTPAIGDLNNDGDLEIIALGGDIFDSLFVWDRYGNYVAPFPVEIGQNDNVKYSVIIGDVLGDQCREICFYIGSPSNVLVLVDVNGNIIWQRQFISAYIDMSPAMGDMNGDGAPEIEFGYHDGLNAGVLVLDSLGNVPSGFPVLGHDAFVPIVADITGNGQFELICGSTEWNVHAYDFHGAGVPGFPIKLGMTVGNSQAIHDIDMDGDLELMVGGFDLKFHVFDIDAHDYDWPRFHYDPYNSGCYKSGYYAHHEYRFKNRHFNPEFQVFPNPFHEQVTITTIFLDIEIACKIYDITGRLVRHFILPIDRDPCIPRSITWDGFDDQGRSLPSGVYFLEMSGEGRGSSIHKVVRIR